MCYQNSLYSSLLRWQRSLVPMWCVATLVMNEGNSLGARVQSAYRLQSQNTPPRDFYLFTFIVLQYIVFKKSILSYKFLFWLLISERGCENPWLYFQARRVRRAEKMKSCLKLTRMCRSSLYKICCPVHFPGHGPFSLPIRST